MLSKVPDTRELTEIFSFINSYDSFVLLGHLAIDGDSLGSLLAFEDFLNNLGKKAVIIYPKEINKLYRYMDGFTNISKNVALLKDYDAVIILDTANKERIAVEHTLFLNKKKTLNIDHHISNTKYADINYVRQASSTGELLFYILRDLAKLFGTSLAKSFSRYNELLSAIYDDTGSLRYSNVDLSTIQAVYELMELGAEPSFVADNLYFSIPRERVKLLSKVYNNLNFAYNGKVSYVYLLKRDMELIGLSSSDTDGVIDIPKMIEGVELAFFAKEVDERKFKFSFRSSVVDVNKFCSKYGGGGHKTASGCIIYGDFSEILDKILAELGVFFS